MHGRKIGASSGVIYPFALCPLLISFVWSSAQDLDPKQVNLDVSHNARSLQPGEVIFVSVWSSAPLEKLQASAFDKDFAFYPEANSQLWQGLIGIDLGTQPGVYQLSLQATAVSGARVQSSYEFSVTSKEFPTRRLTVDGKFVNAPQEMLDRIRQESRRIKDIFTRMTANKIWRGPFLLPVPGTTTSGFGRRSILNGQPRSPHSGTDFRAEEGTQVRAPNYGLVVLVDDFYYSGNTVIVDHGQGLYSYFAHLSRSAVNTGEKVLTGDVIGYVGATGRVTGPHLHWSVRISDTRVDPLSLVNVLSEEGIN